MVAVDSCARGLREVFSAAAGVAAEGPTAKCSLKRL